VHCVPYVFDWYSLSFCRIDMLDGALQEARQGRPHSAWLRAFVESFVFWLRDDLCARAGSSYITLPNTT